MRAVRRWLVPVIGLVFGAATLPGCLLSPADTSQIQLVSTTTVTGWRYDFYRNNAYSCGVSGHQTFLVGTRLGSSAGVAAPLWVWMHGEGENWFDGTGTPQPDPSNLSEASATALRTELLGSGVIADLRHSALGFRLLATSYCDGDLDGGTGQPDPNNPLLNPDQSTHQTNGLLATEAAIQFVESRYSTSRYVLQGIGGGSAGAYNVVYALQLAEMPPAGVIGDSGVVNVEASFAANQQGACSNPAYASPGFDLASQRIDPTLADSNNEIDKLISRGDFKVPVLHIWNHGDSASCGATPMQCPLRDNTTMTLGATDCLNRPLADAIDTQQPNSSSMNLPVCVDQDSTPDCSFHGVTTAFNEVNTDPASPRDDFGTLEQWAYDRLEVGARFAWGENDTAQLGDGTTTSEAVPTATGGTDWAVVAPGYFHTAAIKKDGTLWTWGQNTYGQLGDGTSIDRSTPVHVTQQITFAWAQVAAGVSHTVGIRTDGTLWAWGRNDQGQLGDGTTTDRSTPEQIGTASDWVSVSAAYFATFAIKRDGSLWVWGRNIEGQLGDGTNTNRTSPEQLGTSHDWASVTSGNFHTVAIKTNGTLWTWGENMHGALCDTGADRPAPAQIGTSGGWAAASAGAVETFVLRTDGTLWACGEGGFLGDGTTTDRTSPVSIGTGNNWISVSSGGAHTLALRTDGSMWAWGSQFDGELGDGVASDNVVLSPEHIGTSSWGSVAAGGQQSEALAAP